MTIFCLTVSIAPLAFRPGIYQIDNSGRLHSYYDIPELFVVSVDL